MLPGAGTSFTATQGAWRFLNNSRVTLPVLVAPLRRLGVERCRQMSAPFVLLVQDWSKLAFDDDKADLVPLTHETDLGYELTTTLLVIADDGASVAMTERHWSRWNGICERPMGCSACGMFSTRTPAPRVRGHLEQVPPTMRAGRAWASRAWGLDKPVLPVIDREADSVDHYRR